MSCPDAFRRRVVGVVLSSLAAGLALLAPGLAQTSTGKKHAVIVGVRDYLASTLDPLKYTENDAEELAKVLQEQGGFAVRVLTTTRGEKSKERAPTAANIRASIKALLKGRSRHDTVLVALAGHGIQGKVKEGGVEKDESFFCPSDAQLNDNDTLIALGKLFADLRECGAGVKLLLVDACRNDPKIGRNVDLDALPRAPRGTAALFSCKSGERAFETDKLGKKGHGVFFHFVLEGLKGKAKNSDKEVTWAGLAEYVTRNVNRTVPKLIGGGAKQTPHLLANLEGESPVLVGPDKVDMVRDKGEEKTPKEPIVEKKPGKEPLVKGWGKEVESSIGMKLVRIEPGRFLMGSPAGERERFGDEAQHEVQITKAFWLGVHEVTQEQFKAVMGYNPSYFSSDGTGKAGVEYERTRPGGGKRKVPASTGSFPVENVSWEEAVEFCKRLTSRAAETTRGRTYRLPTEAEWEHACRGGAGSKPFHFGNSLSSAQANFNGASPHGAAEKAGALGRPCKVGTYAPNAFGLYDMHGNVAEWCADGYGADYYSSSPRYDPSGPAESALRVIRGGSWFGGAETCRSARRSSYWLAYRGFFLGFRVALVPSGK
jgi:formylglycine-generating enzyme required for sulfatase activity